MVAAPRNLPALDRSTTVQCDAARNGPPLDLSWCTLLGSTGRSNQLFSNRWIPA